MENRNGTTVLDFARGDVNGDRIPDNVYLTGTKTTGSPFTENITLVIQDGRTGRFTKIHLNEDSGYNPVLFLGNFTETPANDILIGITTGGSGGIMYYYIYSFYKNKIMLLFDFDVYNQQNKYRVTYKDNYKVEVISEKQSTKYILDITYKGSDYLNEIYDKNGKLLEPIEGFVNPLSGLYPVDFDSNKVFELLAYEKIAGRYNADSLGYVISSLKWNNNKFDIFNQYIAIFGAEA